MEDEILRAQLMGWADLLRSVTAGMIVLIIVAGFVGNFAGKPVTIGELSNVAIVTCLAWLGSNLLIRWANSV